jgi:hypothetical protein
MKNFLTCYNAYKLPLLGLSSVLLLGTYLFNLEEVFTTSTLLFGVVAGSFFGSRKTMQCDVELYEKILTTVNEACSW